MRVRPVHVDLLEHGERDPVVLLAKAANLSCVPRFLLAELIAGKTQHRKPTIRVTLVQLLQTLVLRREPALARSVHDQQHLALITVHADGFAAEGFCRKRVDRVHSMLRLKKFSLSETPVKKHPAERLTARQCQSAGGDYPRQSKIAFSRTCLGLHAVIRFNQFSLARGTKPLFEQTTFALNPGEKAGLIGANGAGKSTLFSVLRGDLHADGGDFSMPPSWQIAHVAQETPAVERTALDYTLDGDTQLRRIEARIASASAAHDGAAEADAHAAFADADGYTAPARAETLLIGLGFTLAQTKDPVTSFSGGWRMRLNLAQALMCRSDLLLLDEPTNHLDLDAIVWLEDWLRRYPGTLIVISHDREFLDAICNVTLHLENKQIKRYGGNYSQFEILRAQQLALQQNAYEKQKRNIDHLQSFVDRFKAKASKAKQAQSRVKALEKMELIAPAHVASPFTFEFRTPAAAPNPMMVMESIRCGYKNTESADAPDIVIVDGITLSITNGERIGLLGANGQGKSTLI